MLLLNPTAPAAAEPLINIIFQAEMEGLAETRIPAIVNALST
jgi:hypothetical protein